MFLQMLLMFSGFVWNEWCVISFLNNDEFGLFWYMFQVYYVFDCLMVVLVGMQFNYNGGNMVVLV